MVVVEDKIKEFVDKNYEQFMKNLEFETDNVVVPKINMMDKILRYDFPEGKEKYKDDDVFRMVTEFFQQNSDKILVD